MYCECGCGEITSVAPKTDRQAGTVKGQHVRFRVGHSNRRHDLYIVDEITGCWNWNLSRCANGRYGSYRSRQAHRVIYEITYNVKLDKAVVLDHLCRNTLCVNPTHVEPVSQAVNTRRGITPKLNEEIVRRIRKEITNGERTGADIARELGVTRQAIYRITNGQNWKGVN